MKNATRNVLLQLLETHRVTSSNVPRAARSEIEKFKEKGFISWDRAGRGGVYTIDDREAIQTLLKNTGYHGPTDALTSKARAVAYHKDAHRGKDDTLLLMLSATHEAFWYNNGKPVNLFKIVQDCGIASILIKPGDNWQTDKPLALVENMDLLVHAGKK